MSSRGLNIRLIQIVTKLAMVYALVYESANKSRRENNPDFSACSRTVKVFVAATATKSYCAIQPWLRFSIGHYTEKKTYLIGFMNKELILLINIIL